MYICKSNFDLFIHMFCDTVLIYTYYFRINSGEEKNWKYVVYNVWVGKRNVFKSFSRVNLSLWTSSNMGCTCYTGNNSVKPKKFIFLDFGLCYLDPDFLYFRLM
jgi:hypothetical protein